LLDLVRVRLRLKSYSARTPDSHVLWIKRLILFHGKHRPRDMGAAGRFVLRYWSGRDAGGRAAREEVEFERARSGRARSKVLAARWTCRRHYGFVRRAGCAACGPAV